jgi:hypothetical protein
VTLVTANDAGAGIALIITKYLLPDVRLRGRPDRSRKLSISHLAPLQLFGQRLETLVTKIDAARVQKKSGRM